MWSSCRFGCDTDIVLQVELLLHQSAALWVFKLEKMFIFIYTSRRRFMEVSTVCVCVCFTSWEIPRNKKLCWSLDKHFVSIKYFISFISEVLYETQTAADASWNISSLKAHFILNHKDVGSFYFGGIVDWNNLNIISCSLAAEAALNEHSRNTRIILGFYKSVQHRHW